MGVQMFRGLNSMWDSPRGHQPRLYHACPPPRNTDMSLAGHAGEEDKRYAGWVPDAHDHPAANYADLEMDLANIESAMPWNLEGLEAPLDTPKVLRHTALCPGCATRSCQTAPLFPERMPDASHRPAPPKDTAPGCHSCLSSPCSAA